jgi:hypothetical protein
MHTESISLLVSKVYQLLDKQKTWYLLMSPTFNQFEMYQHSVKFQSCLLVTIYLIIVSEF